MVANRLRPGLTVWWAALVLLGYEWSYGPSRFGIIWAPYAVALPVALLVLLVADVVTSPDPWGPAIATVVCRVFPPPDRHQHGVTCCRARAGGTVPQVDAAGCNAGSLERSPRCQRGPL